jgi:hypothetical protein
MKRLLLLGTVAVVASWGNGVARAQIPTLPPDGGSFLGGPTCGTFDAEGRAATTFRAGDGLFVRGTHFSARSLVLVSLQQPPMSSDLGQFRANDAGELATPLLEIPRDAQGGSAVVRASSSAGTATCDIKTIAAPKAAPTLTPDEAPDGSNPWFLVWAVLLALGASALTFVSYRFWRGRRLERAISDAGDGKRVPARRARPQAPPLLDDAVLPSGAPEPLERPPVLPFGWDEGREPTAVTMNPNGDAPTPAPAIEEPQPAPEPAAPPDENIGW